MRTLGVRRDDRGAVLIIVAAFCVVAVLMLAAVVDLGGLREQRKDVTLSTDAAALAAAGAAVLDGKDVKSYDCSEIPTKTSGVSVEAVAREYLEANDRTVPSDFLCEVEVTGTKRGYVVVGAGETVDYAFGNAVGMPSGSVEGQSIAAISADLGGGVRPVGFCLTEATLNEKAPGVPFNMHTDVINAPKTLDADGNSTKLITPVDIVLEKDHKVKSPDACDTAEASGQRGQLDIASTGNNADGGQCDKDPTPNSFSDTVAHGYFGTIQQQIEADPGNNFNSVKACLHQLVAEDAHFWVPVYETFVKDKGDQYYSVKHFVEVELQGFCLNGEYGEDPVGQTACEFVVDPTHHPKPITSEWWRFTALRVFTPATFPTAPPATSDAASLPPALCGEDASASSRDACK